MQQSKCSNVSNGLLVPPSQRDVRAQLNKPGISTVFATNWYRSCDVHFCAFSAFFLAFCLHSVQRGAFSSCISQRIFVLLERSFAHFKALCCILSASTLLCLGVHLLCIHDAPFLDQCLMCILLHSCILYSMTFLRILNALCVHLCPSLSDTYTTTLCISLAFYVHLALQCYLPRAFSVHLISILAHFVHCSNDLGSRGIMA